MLPAMAGAEVTAAMAGSIAAAASVVPAPEMKSRRDELGSEGFESFIDDSLE
jgi:hypothetical protein